MSEQGFYITQWVCLAIVFVLFVTSIILWERRDRRQTKRINDAEKYYSYFWKKECIAIEKRVDFKSLFDSVDYLTYNHKMLSKERHLTETEFELLKGKIKIEDWPATRMVLWAEKIGEENNESDID